MTAKGRRRAKPATREVGQLRFAFLDAFLPLAVVALALVVARVDGQTIFAACAAGGVLALVRLAAYVGK